MRHGIAGFLAAIGWIGLALTAAAASFFGVARLSPAPPVFCGATVIVAGAILAFGLARSFRRRDGAARGAGLALGLAILAMLGLGAAWSIRLPRDLPAAAPPDLDRFMLHDGNHLAYRKYDPHTAGAGRLAPIIVLHGGPGLPPLKTSFDFYGRLADGGRAVYVYEQIGVGQSSRLDDVSDYSLQRNIDDLEELRAGIGAPRVVLIGQSWGAVLATYYMAQHPDAVERAVLVSPGAFRHRDRFPDDDSRTAAAESPTGVAPPLELVLAGLLARANPQAAQRLAGQAELGRAYDAFWADPAPSHAFTCRGDPPGPALLERDRGANFYAYLMGSASLARAPDPAPALRAARAPTLILRGECDIVPRAVAEDYVAALPNARIVDVRGAGHLAPAARPEQVLAAIAEFLSAPEPVSR